MSFKYVWARHGFQEARAGEPTETLAARASKLRADGEIDGWRPVTAVMLLQFDVGVRRVANLARPYGEFGAEATCSSFRTCETLGSSSANCAAKMRSWSVGTVPRRIAVPPSTRTLTGPYAPIVGELDNSFDSFM